MRPRLRDLPALFPAVVLSAFAGWAGTFAGAAAGWPPMVGHGLLLAAVAIAGRHVRDPLGMGRAGGLLLLALLAAVASSWILSPVPRAGLMALAVLPAFLFLPRAVQVCWTTVERRRLGLLTVSAVVAGVAGWALVDALWLGSPVASPLGHHNLLAAWLVTLLPVALLPWREGGFSRVVAVLAGGLGLVALAGTRSLAAAATVAAVAVFWALRDRRGRIALAAAAVLLLLQAPRLAGLAGSDSSLRARWGYLEAGWRGFLERPAFGWGPGATAWTVSEKMRPVPGVHPPGEAVADLHSLPLELVNQLGLTGGLLAVGAALLFWLRRRAESHTGDGDAGLRKAATTGLAAFAMMSCGGMPLSVTALPVALAIVAGALWAGGGTVERRDEAGETPALPVVATLFVVALAVLSALVAGPLHLARLEYSRAVVGEEPESRIRHLRRAVELDPAFPLYRARLAWLERELRGEPDAGAARRARLAAGDAGAVAPLWLVAGVLGQEAGEDWSRGALIRACRLDPLGAVAPFRLAVGEGPHPLAPEWGARALLADPDLLAASAWEGRGDLLAAAVRWASAAEGVGAGWRARLLGIYGEGLEPSGEVRRKALRLDADASTSFSLFVFRRLPWPTDVLPVEVDAGVLQQLDLVSAARQPTTAPEVFAAGDYCGLGGQPLPAR